MRRGDRVRLEVDNRDFVMHITALDGDHGPETPDVLSDRDVRLAVLQSAADFGASRQDLKSGDVLRIAESWLAWLDGYPPSPSIEEPR